MSSFTDSVLQRLTTANTMRHILNNQMHLVQNRALSGGQTGNTVIRVPYQTPSSQWKIVGLPELDDTTKSNNNEWSYYNGYQLFATEPIKKQFRQEWVPGPLYTQDGFGDDQTFTFNLVDSSAPTVDSKRKPHVANSIASSTTTLQSPRIISVSDNDEYENTDEDSTE